VKGLKQTSAERIVRARAERYFGSAEEVAMLANLEHLDMRQLAAADALNSLSGHWRQQVWDAAALRRPPELLRGARPPARGYRFP
jgi:error-prone DNA polymerase